MSIPPHFFIKGSGPNRPAARIWSDPAFKSLTVYTQVVYFYARYRATTGLLTYEVAAEAGIGMTREEFDLSVSQLRATSYGKYLDGTSRRYIPRSIRREVMDRDGACLHCGTDGDLSLDHIIPYSRGGEDTVENLQVLCRPCNARKGARV